MNKKKIGVLGSGIVAKTLASGFLKHGYEVTIGSSNVTKLEEWKHQNNKGKIGSFSEAAAFGEILVLAVKGSAAKIVLKAAGDDNLKGKTIIDTTNPIADAPPVNGVIVYFTDLNNSLMEQLQVAVPSANFVKCFNSVGNVYMVNPDLGIQPSMFICGNNADSKKEVRYILDQFGWDIEDMGMAEAARAIEPLCMLWCIPGLLQNRWAHAFKLLKS